MRDDPGRHDPALRLAGTVDVAEQAAAARAGDPGSGVDIDVVDPAEVEDKARDLMAPVSGAERAGQLVKAIASLERMRHVTELRPLLQA